MAASPQVDGADLVIGADGMIGRAILAHLRRAGRPVRGTTRRTPAARGLEPLDLAAIPADWPDWPVRTTFLCAAETSLAACEADPAATAAINVAANCRLAERLAGRGAFVVFFSSITVFAGQHPCTRADEPTDPRCEYGRQKAAGERRVLGLSPGSAVLRASKVLGADGGLLGQWSAALRRGEAIEAFEDVFLSPVPLSSVVRAAGGLADRRLAGVWQLSAERDFSYAEAARIGARAIGADESLVRPVRGRGKLSWRPPRHTTMDCSALRDALGIEAPSAEWTIRTAFLNPRLLVDET